MISHFLFARLYLQLLIIYFLAKRINAKCKQCSRLFEEQTSKSPLINHSGHQREQEVHNYLLLIHKHSKSRGPFATKINERGDTGSPSFAVVSLELDQPQLGKSCRGFLIGQVPISRQQDLLGIIHCEICMPLSSQVSRCERGRAYITTKNSLTVRLFCAEFRTKPQQCNTHGNCL